ncbi:hypothetical protein O0I10_010206 [Lichtheimia ornata]|uniref:Uncharacterized protein n=1 Tax=Lichtheimia ornata TaxID=688661 RepID=A0AAD7UXW5_9FUNG|nr:uncharacterized protein O0I10_010206 [Lichtheimia ornata]KAJ8654131.1 hypothetical protein O0I10_010206 [Lichtheimia ornata]
MMASLSCYTNALSADAEITKVNFFTYHFFMSQDVIEQVLKNKEAGEATVILDTSTPSGAMLSDDKPHDRPLTRRLIPIEMECPKLQELTRFHCHQKGHFRRHCPVAYRERQAAAVDSLTDLQLLDTYPTTAILMKSTTTTLISTTISISTRQHLRNQNPDTASSNTCVTRNMSQQRLQQSAGESPDPQHHQ